MRIYIVEDDISVISILEDIVESNDLGTVCGDSGSGLDLDKILALAPDLVLVDLLMPGKDGIQVVRELKERGCLAKFIMISQVSSKEMVAKAYLAGVDFFISKPINLIEVRQVIRNIRQQMEMNEICIPSKVYLPSSRPRPWSASPGLTCSASASSMP